MHPYISPELTYAQPLTMAPPVDVLAVFAKNTDEADLFAEWFELRGWTAAVAYSGEEGLERARTSRPGVIVADDRLWPACDLWTLLQLTHDERLRPMSGIEMVRQLRTSEATQDIPVIFMTCHDSPEFQRAARAVGACKTFLKPVSLDVLEACVAVQLGHRVTVHQRVA